MLLEETLWNHQLQTTWLDAMCEGYKLWFLLSLQLLSRDDYDRVCHLHFCDYAS